MPVESLPVEIMNVAAPLLAWYDRHARALPWRSAPGSAPPDPYRVWLSEIMLQQTTVAAVRPYFERFVARWPDVAALASAEQDEVMEAWAGLGYYSRARNLHACARAVVAAGKFPDDEAGLRALPGVGRYTAAAVAAIAFGKRAVLVDGNVERVVARLFAVATPLPAAKSELYRLTDTVTPQTRSGDFAQAMMDLGATLCTPRAPDCSRCPLADLCKARTCDPASYPRRAAKFAKPERSATAWWIERDGQVLLVRRPAKGLLGGMLALPSDLAALTEGGWTPAFAGVTLGSVTHVFTHFRLRLEVVRATLTPGCVLPLGAQWWSVAALDSAGLPTLFVKAARLALRGE